jgi:hypothetical protein
MTSLFSPSMMLIESAWRLLSSLLARSKAGGLCKVGVVGMGKERERLLVVAAAADGACVTCC